MAATASNVPTLTQQDINYLTQIYGGGLNAGQMGLKVGMPISQLVPAYTNLAQSGEVPSELMMGAQGDPVLAQLMAGGWLQQGSDVQGNAGLTVGPAWEATQPRTGTKDAPLTGASAVFGIAPTGAISTITNPLDPMQAANTSGWTNTKYGAPDPLTGLVQMLQGTPQAQFSHNFLDELGPGGVMSLIAAPLFAPLFAELGPLGSSLFKTVGNELQGNQPNPLASLISIISSQLGSG